jgi:predicted phage terminase large subunit-like protein
VVTKPLRKEKQIVILEAFGKRLSADQLVDEIFRLTRIYSTERVLIETFGAQLWLVKILQDEMIKRGQYFTITEVRGSTRESKAARIRGLLPYYANNRILHRPGLDDLEAELIQFPRSKHDDIVDALAYQILFWKEILSGDAPNRIKRAEPFSVDWFKSRIPKHQTVVEKIFKGIIRRRPSL